MSAEGFKKSYVRWSYAVAVCITTILMTITLCDIKLGYDFSENMYIISVYIFTLQMSIVTEK